MELRLHSLERITVIEVAGRVDTYRVSELRTQLQEAMKVKPSYLVVDMSEVEFIDSSGLAALVYGMKSCRDNGGHLCLCNPQRRIRMILEMTRLDTAFDIFSNEAEAISALAQ